MFPTRKPLTTSILAGLVLLVLALNACLPATPENSAPEPGALHTQAVQTVSAQLTLSAGATAAAQLTQIAEEPATEATPTQEPVLPTPTATAEPTEVLQPSETPVPPTPTQPALAPTIVPPSPTPQPCDRAHFVNDLSVEDGTKLTPGARFTKTWRLKNTGACTWTSDYDLVFASGNRMDGGKAVDLGKRVRPGETVDVSVELIAPKEPGEYTGRWMLRNADGKLFGFGNSHDQPVWVSVKVVRPAKRVWDMAADACQATWTTGAVNGIGCLDANQDSTNGFVKLELSPVLENGRHENETALLTYPNAGENGFIQGQFQVYKVKDGDHFQAIIGCLAESKGCKVTFQISYRNRNGKVRTLATWREKYDEKIQKIDVDLSDLAGKEIQLILTVISLDDNTNDRAFWLRPSIWR